MKDILRYWKSETDRKFDHEHYGSRYLVGPRVLRQVARAHERKGSEPISRRLRVYAIDPAAGRFEEQIATLEVPYEPLQPGPVGVLIEVDNTNGHTNEVYAPADLDDLNVVVSSGYAPSESNHRFHAQMVYAVASQVHASFRRALGRQIGWPFDGPAEVRRLRILPFADEQRNAWYDPNEGTLNFGYFDAAEKPTDRTLPKGVVYTALAHDIVAHEMSHAMLDALRANFSTPSSSDMTGFHEGFADLIALFHHFHHRDALRRAIATSRGDIRNAKYLTGIGQQFGRSAGGAAELRPLDLDRRYDAGLECHEMGQLLVATIFDAFAVVFERKALHYRRLATGGTGVFPEGELPDLLVDLLTKKAADLAKQFLSMLIRAVDYLPPVDVRLGEYLRAIVTADSDLSTDDPLGFRDALIDSFRIRGIYPRDVVSLNEDSLLWRSPRMGMEPIKDLSFREIWFQGDPGLPVSVGEQIAQACALGEFITSDRERMQEFGLVMHGDPLLEGDEVSLPRVESVRTLRRPGPDGRVVFDTVAEIIQERHVRPRDGSPGFDIHGGSTVILDSLGQVRLVVLKRVVGEGRVNRRLEYLESSAAKPFWKLQDDRYVPAARTPFLAMCDRSEVTPPSPPS